mmetsp:Transcript_27661/g.69317  ORF Transcript_27661/g.69317 Transcript_27661/m.69317 type:complete len:214 (+) Transcript_27661:1198-1839(+)
MAVPLASVSPHPDMLISRMLVLLRKPLTNLPNDASPMLESANDRRTRLWLEPSALPMDSHAPGPRLLPTSSSISVRVSLSCAPTAAPSRRQTRSLASADDSTSLAATICRARTDLLAASSVRLCTPPPPRCSHLSRITVIFRARRRPSPSTCTSSVESGMRFTAMAPARDMLAASVSGPSAMPGRSRRFTSVLRSTELFHAPVPPFHVEDSLS